MINEFSKEECEDFIKHHGVLTVWHELHPGDVVLERDFRGGKYYVFMKLVISISPRIVKSKVKTATGQPPIHKTYVDVVFLRFEEGGIESWTAAENLHVTILVTDHNRKSLCSETCDENIESTCPGHIDD